MEQEDPTPKQPPDYGSDGSDNGSDTGNNSADAGERTENKEKIESIEFSTMHRSPEQNQRLQPTTDPTSSEDHKPYINDTNEKILSEDHTISELESSESKLLDLINKSEVKIRIETGKTLDDKDKIEKNGSKAIFMIIKIVIEKVISKYLGKIAGKVGGGFIGIFNWVDIDKSSELSKYAQLRMKQVEPMENALIKIWKNDKGKSESIRCFPDFIDLKKNSSSLYN